jgi:hypothetical protein
MANAQKNSQYWGKKIAKLRHLPGDERGAPEAPKGLVRKNIPPNSPYGTHQPNQRFFLKCFFFLAKFSQ